MKELIAAGHLALHGPLEAEALTPLLESTQLWAAAVLSRAQGVDKAVAAAKKRVELVQRHASDPKVPPSARAEIEIEAATLSVGLCKHDYKVPTMDMSKYNIVIMSKHGNYVHIWSLVTVGDFSQTAALL